MLITPMIRFRLRLHTPLFRHMPMPLSFAADYAFAFSAFAAAAYYAFYAARHFILSFT